MECDDNGWLARIRRILEYYFLALIAAAIILVVIVDLVLPNTSLIIQPGLDFVSNNRDELTVILSGLLLFAYLMQYWNQRTQRKIMNRQTSLMQAGYTPILGGSMREWGSQRSEDINDIDDREANRLYLNLSNSGNTAARNLRIWSGIDHEASSELEHDYRPGVVPLRRTSNTSWWQVDQGGAIAPQHHEPTEFQADLKLRKVKMKFRLFEDESTLIHLHSAFEQLEDAGIGRVEIGFVLKYTSTTGAEEMIPIGAYEADFDNLGERGMRIHYAQENEEERAKEIYNRLN